MMLNKAQGQLAKRGSLVVLTTVGALCFGGASSAMAAVVSGTGDSPVYTAGTGAIDNSLTVTQRPDGTRVTFHEEGSDPITIGPGATDCAPDTSTPGDVTCTAPAGPVTAIEINLGDGDDDTTLTDVTATTIQDGGAGSDSLSGGTGDDNLSGGEGSDLLWGDAGTDELHGGGGIDYLIGGDGDDKLFGDAGNDVLFSDEGADDIHGGDGIDHVDLTSSAPQTLTLNDVNDDGVDGERDNVHSDVEDADTSTGNDRLVGSSGANSLVGDDGDDDITGEGGVDVLLGAAGDDTIHARDGQVDTILCGAGNDVVFADANDVIIDDDPSDEHCETVNLPAPSTTTTTTTGSTGTGTTAPANTTPATTGIITIGSTALLAPRSLSLTASPARNRKRPYKVTVKGTLALPAGVPKAQGCVSGTVTVTGKRGRKNAFAPKTVKITKNCGYSVTATVGRKARVKLTARFSGNNALKPTSSASRTVRTG